VAHARRAAIYQSYDNGSRYVIRFEDRYIFKKKKRERETRPFSRFSLSAILRFTRCGKCHGIVLSIIDIRVRYNAQYRLSYNIYKHVILYYVNTLFNMWLQTTQRDSKDESSRGIERAQVSIDNFNRMFGHQGGGRGSIWCDMVYADKGIANA